jgi:hypothetical protein
MVFDLTTYSSSLLGGRRRRYHLTTPPGLYKKKYVLFFTCRLIYRLNCPAGSGQSFSVAAMTDLLKAASDAGLKVVGVTLNLSDPGLDSLRKSVSLARLIFALGQGLGHDLRLLDLGELTPHPENPAAFEEVGQPCFT